ncbi:MAG: bifunctional 5,10-methylenetetrahydrofolate dehydrogenase/5,10-methenyltetrahydrofolate cyclohydrolase [Erysipelotrichaceae bacterium]|nr:bifunctional 5,10-methylenetetrahydrofolate dehydrogenase/5,10-methenyltetrahydrofolate cyclohydrolase [Erysipelotrichaceae bacterium]
MLLKGKEVANSINEESIKKVNELKEKGITPTLAIVRVGENESDLSYERNATKKCNEIGVNVNNIVLDKEIEYEKFYQTLDTLNNDDSIHGILMLRPLPKYLDNEKARKYIAANKDIDGCSDNSLAGIFTNTGLGFPPCTAEAAIKILEHYNIDVVGKNVVVLGRSLVIGKPVSMMLLNKNATVTICHTKTKNVFEITNKADIIICATGAMESINKDYVKQGQTIIDVGISWNQTKQKLCGDVLFEEVEPIVENITPVPGGVGSVTTSVLVSHVVEAAYKLINK